MQGNPGGPGNPHGRQVAELRRVILEAVTPDDLRAIIAALVKKAKAGDITAAREVLDRCFGKPAQQTEFTTVSALNRVQIVLPDNGRGDTLLDDDGPTIQS